MPFWILLLSQFSILALAALAGVFLAFSDFIMRALGATGGSGGPEAMQAINREVFRYVFMTLFIGMVPVSLLMGGAAYMTLAAPAPFIAAAAIYVVGAFGVTVLFNVPMNNALAALDATSTDGLGYWTAKYLPDWTFWNSVRTAACFAASALLLFAVTQVQAV